MNPIIIYRDRSTHEMKKEKVYYQKSLFFIYKRNVVSRFLAFLTAKLPFFSLFYGFLQNLPWSKKKILPFIKKYDVNTSEFKKEVDEFVSFNDFFTRELKKEARPIHAAKKTAIIPADGRYLFYQNLDKSDGFVVKGKKFSLNELLKNEALAEKYLKGSMVISRLCPSDYHRFHFPIDCFPGEASLINGPLYSVSPFAIKQNIRILSQNKRMITMLKNELFGDVLFIEVGATCVGTIKQTYHPFQHYKKGDEKGYFSFGGSSIILLFEQNRIIFDNDLIEGSSQHTEILCHMGQSLGTKKEI